MKVLGPVTFRIAPFTNHRKSNYIRAMDVRKTYLDYFNLENHTLVRSSPVKPFSDPTLEFVNAGMNQFKNVFLGLTPPPCARAVNSQKCIRVGGKHNDINSVGYDTYHHTFFEMLGNWSFADYFKAEACKLAWKLLTTKPYSLDPGRLYVTYFGGDAKLSLPPDLETREIWREIGVKEQRIIPFSSKENFWEMGPSGPCGPCTEIHYDHIGTLARSNLVNTDLPDLTELWNLVFIQYNRLEDGTIVPLKEYFVDTGMGLERLTAILQGQRSNYDTDLFTPLFNRIAKCSNIKNYEGKFGDEDSNGIDTNYRILADHVRMIAVSLADNVYPDESHGLRRVVRKSLLTSEKFLPNKGLNLILELVKVLGDTLGPVYPEIISNYRQIKHILISEQEVWKQVQSSVEGEWRKILAKYKQYATLNEVQSTGLVSAIKEINKLNLAPGSCLKPEFSLILYDRYGLPKPVIEELARINGLKLNDRQLEFDIVKLKERNKLQQYSASKLELSAVMLNDIASSYKATDDSYKYCYTRNKIDGVYGFDQLTAKVLRVVSRGNFLKKGDTLKTGSEVSVILDRTNFWTSLKGDSDRGSIVLHDADHKRLGDIQVSSGVHCGSFVLHHGTFVSDSSPVILPGELSAILRIDADHRLTIMKNNMASHLLAKAIKSKFVANVQSFINTSHCFVMKFNHYEHNISEGDLMMMEHDVNMMISQGLDISFSRVMSHELNFNDTYVSPFINITNNAVPLITYKLGSVNVSEITSGPVVLNSRDVEEFCLVNIELNRKKHEFVLKGLTGARVHQAYNETSKLLAKLDISFADKDVEELDELRNEAKNLVNSNLVPQSLRIELNNLVNNLNNEINENILANKKNLMESAITEARNNLTPFVIHYSEDDAKLDKLTKLCTDLPVMVFAYNRGHLTARCSVPASSTLNADDWMAKVSEKIGSKVHHYQGYNSSRVCGMKPIKMSKVKLIEIVERAKSYAEITALETLGER